MSWILVQGHGSFFYTLTTNFRSFPLALIQNQFCSSSSESEDEDESSGDESKNPKAKGQKSDASSKQSPEKKKKGKKNAKKNETIEFMKNRQRQPYRLHNELWDNQPEELNDGPACRCSLKARKFGIRHGIYQVWSLTKF